MKFYSPTHEKCEWDTQRILTSLLLIKSVTFCWSIKGVQQRSRFCANQGNLLQVYQGRKKEKKRKRECTPWSRHKTSNVTDYVSNIDRLSTTTIFISVKLGLTMCHSLVIVDWLTSTYIILTSFGIESLSELMRFALLERNTYILGPVMYNSGEYKIFS